VTGVAGRLCGHANANLPLVRLGTFRAELHACFPRRADALFELGDALLCTPAVPSLLHLSLEPVCRRGWGSAYAALAHGRIDAERLRDLLAGCLPDADPLSGLPEVLHVTVGQPGSAVRAASSSGQMTAPLMAARSAALTQLGR
jgi:hypothetical protein